MIRNQHEIGTSICTAGEQPTCTAGEQPFSTPMNSVNRVAMRSTHQVTSEQLLGAQGEMVILHGGRQYRLRITQNGKLILTA